MIWGFSESNSHDSSDVTAGAAPLLQPLFLTLPNKRCSPATARRQGRSRTQNGEVLVDWSQHSFTGQVFPLINCIQHTVIKHIFRVFLAMSDVNIHFRWTTLSSIFFDNGHSAGLRSPQNSCLRTKGFLDPQFKHSYTGWGPKDSFQLRYKWTNSMECTVYSRYNELVNGVYKPTT